MKKLNTNQSVIQRLLERYPRGGAWMRMFFMLVLIMLSSASVKADLEFGIKVAGVEVTSNMRYDLTEIPGVSGKASFDPNTRTLTLENATIESSVDDYAIYNESCSDLNIEVIGTCRISTSEYAAIGICESTSIYGDNGSNLFLDVQTWACAIYLDKAPLDIVNCTVEAEGANWGIAGNGEDTEVLTIRNSVVKVNIKKKDDGCASIYNIGNLVLDGCSIIEPSGAAYDKTLKSVALNGEVVKDKVVIEPDANGINDITVDVTARKQGIFTVEGVKLTQQWENLPTGIYIVDGIKRVKK